jgi:hypothetical protein
VASGKQQVTLAKVTGNRQLATCNQKAKCQFMTFRRISLSIVAGLVKRYSWVKGEAWQLSGRTQTGQTGKENAVDKIDVPDLKFLRPFYQLMSHLGQYEWRILVALLLIVGGVWLTINLAEEVLRRATPTPSTGRCCWRCVSRTTSVILSGHAGLRR